MRLALLAAAVLSLAAAGCSKSNPASGAPAATASSAAPAAKPAAEIPSLTVDEVDHELAAKQITAVDCNGDRLRQKYGVIPGAILLADIEDYGANVLPADKNTKLVFYCHDPG